MGARAWIGLLDRIAVHSDVDQLADSVTSAIGFGIISGTMAFPVIEVTGSLMIAGILFVLSLLTVIWLSALIIRGHGASVIPIYRPRWLAVARATMGDDLIDAMSKRLRDTPPRDPEQVLRRGEIITRSSTNAASVSMPAEPRPEYGGAMQRRGLDR